MEGKAVDSVEMDDDEETISDSFICCVCLDILYKPIALECGHVSCFWCVHKSMNGFHESHCPICRHSYHHFPTVCEMLHFLLLKMYPLAYRRREKQVLEEEKQMGCFSPELDGKQFSSVGGSKTPQDATTLSSMPSAPCVDCEGKDCLKEDTNGSAAINKNNLLAMNHDGTCSTVSRTDVLCPACKQIIFRPVVLNCGHVFCEACVIVPEDGIIICNVCESPHPTDFPNVCLEFNNFLEEKFPEEYAARRQYIEHKQAQFQHKNPPACSSSKKTAKKGFPKISQTSDEFVPWWTEHGSNVHMGAGCDYCGMYPIVGDRYRCQDCVERMGFDLCGDCYNTPSKRPGRFNQQHTPDHRFELVKQSEMHKIMLRVVGGHLVDGSGTPILAISAIEDTPDGWIAVEPADPNAVVPDSGEGDVMHDNTTQDGPISIEFSNAPENAGNDAASPAHPIDDGEQHGNNSPSTT